MAGITFLPDGRYIGGVAGGGAWANNKMLAAPPAGVATAWSGDWVLYQSAAGTIRAIRTSGLDDHEVSQRPASFLAADSDGNFFASYLQDGHTGVITSEWQQWPSAALLGVASGGVVFLRTSLNDGGVSAWQGGFKLWDVPTAQPLPMPVPQFSALDANRCCWTENGALKAYGLPQPAQTDAIFDPSIVEVGGTVWIVYHGGPVILRKWTDASQGYILDPAGGYYTVVSVVDGRHVEVAYSRGPSAAGDIVTVTQDLTAPMVPLTAPPPAYDPIVAIGRPCWFGWYVFGQATFAPHTCNLLVPQSPKAYVTDLQGKPVYRYVQASPDSDVDALERAIAAAKADGETLPVLCYWTAQAQAIRVPKGADVYGVEAYQHQGESNSAFAGRAGASVAKVPRAVIIAQCYTSNAGNTSDLRTIPPVVAQITRDNHNVEGIINFSGAGRATGWQDHAEVHADWQKVYDGIPGPPVVVTPPQPQPPDPPVPPHPQPPDPTPIPPQPQPPEDRDMLYTKTLLAGFQVGELVSVGGGVAIKKPDGHFVTVTPEGNIEERPNGPADPHYTPGSWETFVKSGSFLVAKRDGNREYAFGYIAS